MASISIGELLVDNGQITPEELEQAEAEIKKTGEPIAAVLSKLGFITENSLKNALELQYGVMYMNLSKREPEHELISLLPEQVIREQQAVPVAHQGDRLTVAMVDPNDSKAFDVVSRSVKGGKQVKAVVCLEEQFLKFVDQAFGKTSNGNGAASVPDVSSKSADAAKSEESAQGSAPSSAPDETKAAEHEDSKSSEANQDEGSKETSLAAKHDDAVTAKHDDTVTAKHDDAVTAKNDEASDDAKSASETESRETESRETKSKETESQETESQEIESKETESKETESKETESKESEPKMYSDQHTFDTQEMRARPAPGFAEVAAAAPPIKEEESPPKVEHTDTVSEHDLAKRAQEEAIVLLANQILGSAIKRHCSNIHITMNQRESLVHYRMNGRLVLDRKLPNTIVTSLVARYKMMARLNLAERKEPQDGHIKVKSASKEIVCLISVVPQDHGENVVIWIV